MSTAPQLSEPLPRIAASLSIRDIVVLGFILSREPYGWLRDSLGVYKPRQPEFGRLNVTGTVTSKRKILKSVKNGYICDWDSPRLYVPIALRKDGTRKSCVTQTDRHFQ